MDPKTERTATPRDRAPGRPLPLLALLALAGPLALGGCADEGGDADAAEDAPARAEQPAGAGSAEPAEPISVAGFRTPESVLHDEEADVYLVSNLNGSPVEKDGNGFISRVSPDGEVLELRWIDGAAEGVRLSAPKGMALADGRLLVTDIDTVRIFDRETGEPMGAWGIPDATFLNDLATGPDGAVYVSDTGVRVGADGGFEPTGSAAVYRLAGDGTPTALARGDSLMGPNGLAADEGGVVVAPFASNVPLRLGSGGVIEPLDSLPAGGLDGIVRLQDGSFLISSWDGQAVYGLGTTGGVSEVLADVEAPADIGYDARRNRLLIPLFAADEVRIHPLP